MVLNILKQQSENVILLYLDISKYWYTYFLWTKLVQKLFIANALIYLNYDYFITNELKKNKMNFPISMRFFVIMVVTMITTDKLII